MILYIENPKDSTRKLLQLISEFSKIEGYKIIAQKSLAFLYTNNEKSEKLRNQSHSPLQQKWIKYLGINLPTKTKELNSENYKILMKEIKDDINRWRDIAYSWVGRFNIVKMTTLPNTIYNLDSMRSLSMAFFTELEPKNLTIHMETQKTLNSQSSLEKEKWSWRNQHSWLQIILQSYSHQDKCAILYWHKNRNIDQ